MPNIYLWGCRNKFCCRYCFTVHLPHVKATGALYWKGKGGLADRSKLFFSPFQTISPRVNTIIIRELGSDRFKLFFWRNYLPHHFTHNMSALYRLSGGGEERWSFYNILFNSVWFRPISPLPQNCIWKGWHFSAFPDWKVRCFSYWWEYSVAGQWLTKYLHVHPDSQSQHQWPVVII